MNRKQRKQRNRRWLALYETNQAFGGPEEGGWWYHVGTPVPGTAESFFSRSKLYLRIDALTARADAVNKARGREGDLGSVCCTGALTVRVTKQPPAPFPTYRPHYE